LIHCSDGWDRSSQLTSMTQLLLDPFYRTLKGFLILIQKEWLSFGHQFGYRNGFYTKELSQDERSPIFLQWLDCVHQLIFQYPNLFEFNNQLLLFLSYHLNSAKYGTFLFNNEYERKLKCYNAKNLTVSIWTDILESINNSNDKNIPFIAENLNEKKEYNFMNPFYNETANYSNRRLKPNFGFNKLRLWEEYFLRYVILPEYGKFSCEFPLYKTLSPDDKSIKNTLEYLNIAKKNITHSVFYEMDKLNEQNILKEKEKEIENLKDTIKDLCLNLGFSISDYNILSNKTKKNLEIVSNSLPNEVDGYIIFKPNK
jgi:Myotubularin-like phosphatase domain